jgi:hypothetical protein
MHDKAAAAVRNSFAAWREVTPAHNQLVDTILGANLHIIATMRTKTAYDMVDENGKKKPVKIGLAPVQRDGMEYEFTVVMDLSIEGHVATATKDRTRLFDGQHFIPAADTGESLREWLETGKDPAEASKQILKRLKAEVSKISSVPHLENWWRKHQPDIGLLVDADAEKLKAQCALRKAAIISSIEPQKGNGTGEAGLDAVAPAHPVSH